MIRKNLLIAGLLSLPLFMYAQKGTVKIDVKGGFALPEKEKLDMNATGYVLGVNFKYYLNNRFYTLVKGSGSRMNADAKVRDFFISPNDSWPADATVSRNMTDIMLGLGVGYDILQKNKHTLYFQGAFGIGTQQDKEEVWDDRDNDRNNGYSIYDRSSYNTADWALTGDLGYTYSLTDRIGIGASYSADYIVWGFSQSFNLNFQLTF